LVGASVACTTVTSGLVAYNYKHIKKIFSFSGAFAFAYFVIAIAFAILCFTEVFGLIILAMFIAGCGLGLLLPNSTTWLIATTPEKTKGRALGYLITALFLGQFVSPILISPLVTSIGLKPSFGVYAGIVAFVCIIFLIPIMVHFFQRQMKKTTS